MLNGYCDDVEGGSRPIEKRMKSFEKHEIWHYFHYMKQQINSSENIPSTLVLSYLRLMIYFELQSIQIGFQVNLHPFETFNFLQNLVLVCTCKEMEKKRKRDFSSNLSWNFPLFSTTFTLLLSETGEELLELFSLDFQLYVIWAEVWDFFSFLCICGKTLSKAQTFAGWLPPPYLAHAFIVQNQIFRVQLTVCKWKWKVFLSLFFILHSHRISFSSSLPLELYFLLHPFMFTFSAHLNALQRVSQRCELFLSFVDLRLHRRERVWGDQWKKITVNLSSALSKSINFNMRTKKERRHEWIYIKFVWACETLLVEKWEIDCMRWVRWSVDWCDVSMKNMKIRFEFFFSLFLHREWEGFGRAAGKLNVRSEMKREFVVL